MTNPALAATIEIKHATASASSRTISGLIVPFGEVGYASSGPTRYSKGSLRVPADLSRVKLLIQHDTYAAAVGEMTDYSETNDGATATFYLPPGDAGDEALAAAADGTRDGLSIGTLITDYTYDPQNGDTIIVAEAGAQLTEVSLVTIPAFQSARVIKVTAATDQQRISRMTTTPTPQPAAPAQPTEPVVPATAAATEPPAEVTEHDVIAFTAALRQIIAANPQAAQVIPPAAGSEGKTLRQIASEFAAGYRAGKSPFELVAAINSTAALTDIVPANDAGEGFIRPQWEGQLWQASRATRPFIDAAGTPKGITGLKVQGWQYDLTAMPTIDPYAGDKAAIPTSNIKTKPVEADVVRRAGGWDFDRVYVDLGSPDFIEATLVAALDDYKRKSETFVVDGLLTAATAVTGGTTFADNLARLGSAAVTLGASLTKVAMSTDQWLAFAALSESDVPWWLRNQGSLNLGTTSGNAGGIEFESVPELADGTILAVDGRAYTVYEKAPISVQALNIPNGGIDLGVFAYLSMIVNDARAVLKITAPAGA
jgi:HK97 family phage prohead protease